MNFLNFIKKKQDSRLLILAARILIVIIFSRCGSSHRYE